MAILIDMALLLAFATVLALIARYLNQPIIVAYLAAGVLLGPGLQWITNQEIIFTLSELGAAFLLFLVGLEIDLTKLKRVGLVAAVGGLTQSILLFTIGMTLAIALTFPPTEAAYLGLMLAFSSTMLIVKTLSDRKELDTIHGRIIVGFLVLEDLLAIIAITVLGSINTFSLNFLALSLVKVLALVLACLTLAKLVLPAIFRYSARSIDLLFLLAVSTCIGYAVLFEWLGLSLAIGAFIAGISLAMLPWNIEIVARVKSLRDFFATIFFVSLGLNLGVTGTSSWLPFLLFLAIIFILKPLITQTIVQFFGYKRKTAFNVASTMAQTSEFSLIIASLGLGYGHISIQVYTLVVLTAVATMTVSSYIIKHRQAIYSKFHTVLPHLDRLSTHDDLCYGKPKHSVILCGYNRAGFHILKTLKQFKQKIFVVDYNPEIIRSLAKKKQPCLYGDITDDEVLNHINLREAKLVISTAPEYYDNLRLLRKAKRANPNLTVILTAQKVDEALGLYERGADYVIIPHILSGSHVSLMLEGFRDNITNILSLKHPHIKELKKHRTKHPTM